MQTDFWSYTAFPSSGNRDTWLRVGLADTGVRATHTLLSGTSGNRISVTRDCFVGTQANCSSPAGDPTDHLNHGTSSAAIISGNSYPTSYLGVTWYSINSYKVYNDVSAGLDYPAAIRAVQTSEANGDQVLVVEAQGIAENDMGLADAADAAARAFGITVVAANGNGALPGVPGGDNTLPRSPGVARNVLAVGWVDAVGGQLGSPRCAGPTADGRIKPDILAPANVYTASNVADDGDLAIRSDTFNATSCATAFAGGLSAVMYNMHHDIPFNPGMLLDAPGENYAEAIADGDNWVFDNTNGAGLASLPNDWCQNGSKFFGEVTLNSSTQVVEVPFQFYPDPGCAAGANRIDAAIWWSEISTAPHLGVNLFLVDPTASIRDSSTHGTSVFQKVRYLGSAANMGQWKLRIIATRTPDRDTRLYYNARIATW